MSQNPRLLISGFCDESSSTKKIDEQFSVFAALGIRYVTLRFLDVGHGTKNIMQLSDSEVETVKGKLDEYQLTVSSLGSPIGKVKLLDVEDGTPNVFRPFAEYLEEEVSRALSLAESFDTKLIRGFSFYPPKGDRPEKHLSLAAERLREIADRCEQRGLTFGLEVEANLIGQTGELMAELHSRVDHPALFLIFDGGNLVTQGFRTEEIFAQWQAMKSGLGWLHIKDYRRSEDPGNAKPAWIDEDALDQFVPADIGDSGYEAILRDLYNDFDVIASRVAARGIPGVFADLEPHLRGGGQFGGFSGADGTGIALRALCRVLDTIPFHYDLREFHDLRKHPGRT